MKKFNTEAAGIAVERIRYDCVSEDINLNHCHDRFEILYVVEGFGKCVVEGIEHPIRPRSLIVFLPLIYHSVVLDDGVQYERVSVKFDEACVADVVKGLLNSFIGEKFSAVVFYQSDYVSDAIASVMDRFEALDNFPQNERGKLLRLLLSELVVLLSMVKREAKDSEERELGSRVLNYINEHLYDDITLDSLAKRFFVSKYYLCRAFKSHNGISVHGYITKKRVIRAKQLIESGETAASAADIVGFGDYSAFYRAYTKLIGVAPMTAKNAKKERI